MHVIVYHGLSLHSTKLKEIPPQPRIPTYELTASTVNTAARLTFHSTLRIQAFNIDMDTY